MVLYRVLAREPIYSVTVIARRIPLLTVGYEGVTLDAFLDALQAAGVETLVDVRQMPLSRKRGFSKRALSEALGGRGIHYVHEVELGCPRQVRDAYRVDGSWPKYTVGYLAHLATQAQAVDRVVFRALRSRCALLCFEADYRVCHRRYVADAAAERSSRFETQHLDLVTRTGAAALAAPRRVGR